MSNWTIETTENFDGKQFYIIIENSEQHVISNSDPFLIGDYPRIDLLLDDGANLETIEWIYEIEVAQNASGSSILVIPKEENEVISESDAPVNGLFVIISDSELLGRKKSRGKLGSVKEGVPIP